MGGGGGLWFRLGQAVRCHPLPLLTTELTLMAGSSDNCHLGQMCGATLACQADADGDGLDASPAYSPTPSAAWTGKLEAECSWGREHDAWPAQPSGGERGG